MNRQKDKLIPFTHLSNKIDLDFTHIIQSERKQQFELFVSELDSFQRQLRNTNAFFLSSMKLSIKSNFNLEESLLPNIRYIVGDENLEFMLFCTYGPPPEVNFTQAALDSLQDEIEAASLLPLPDDDDDL